MNFEKVVETIEGQLQKLYEADVRINDDDSPDIIRQKDMRFGKISGVQEVLTLLREKAAEEEQKKTV